MIYDLEPTPLVIEGTAEPSIINYFATINQEQFDRTADLLAVDGELLAPFEQPIVGRKAIADYLAKEAKGMELLPKNATTESGEDRTRDISVKGKVKTPLFGVNVAWQFKLNESGQIMRIRIKLLASPQELLGLKKVRDKE